MIYKQDFKKIEDIDNWAIKYQYHIINIETLYNCLYNFRVWYK